MIKFWKNKKVLITGHTGFKGSWLSSILFNYGCTLYGYSLPPKSKKGIFSQCKINKLFNKSIYGNINNEKKLEKFILESKPQIIFHMAAQPIVLNSYNDPVETFETNVLGTVKLLNILRKTKSTKSLIVVTSDKCYLNSDKKIKFFKETDHLGGQDPYSASKGCAEIVTKSFEKSFYEKSKLNCATVRAGNVIGGGDDNPNRIFTDIANALYGERTLSIRNPNSIRPWQHILDPLAGYIRLAELLYKDKKKFIGAWNFGPNRSSIKSVINIINEVKKIKNVKYSIIKNKNALYESKYLGLDISKSKSLLKWKPKLSFKESVKLTISWYLAKNKEEITTKQIKNYFKDLK